MAPRPAETYRGYRRNEAHGRPHTAVVRPATIRRVKGQTPVPATAGLPLARLCRDVATQGYGFVRHVLHDANVQIVRYNEAMRRIAAKKRLTFVPRKPIHPTKKGPGRGTW